MANKFHDAFDKIEASDELKRVTLGFLQAERQKRAGHKIRPAVFRTMAAVCAMLILAIIIGGYSMIQTPVSFVSIDVNPSVELALNRFDRVVSAKGYNEDGESVLDGVSVKWKKYTEAIDLIIDSANMSAYLTSEAELVFTVAAGSSDKNNELRTGINSCSGCMKHGGQSLGADMESVSKAHENGVSLGKYSAYLRLSQYDETVTVDDCRSMSMAEIHDQIKEHEHKGKGHSTDGGETGSGDETKKGNRYRHHKGNHK